MPGLLLVEDDPTSRAFLLAATQGLAMRIDEADSVASAIALATQREHALWLIDANLPDGSGTTLLEKLRALGLRTPALAHTAARGQEALDALVAEGFVAAVAKPLTAEAWLAAIRSALDATPTHRAVREPRPFDADGNTHALPLWDDTVAMAALGGNTEHVAALRQLFIGELPTVCASVETAVAKGDHTALAASLHRLRASCGFTGAVRLDAAACTLRTGEQPVEALAAFLVVAQVMLAEAGR